MGASTTGKGFRPRGRRPSIERASLGRLYERVGRVACRRRGWRPLAYNFHFRGGEIDILVQSAEGWVVVEVRGRRDARYRPRDYFPPDKARRLLAWAERIGARRGVGVRVVLLEIVGEPPGNRLLWWLVPYFPGRLGLRLEWIPLEGSNG